MRLIDAHLVDHPSPVGLRLPVGGPGEGAGVHGGLLTAQDLLEIVSEPGLYVMINYYKVIKVLDYVKVKSFL